MASVGSFRFKILIAMTGIPAHLRGVPVAQRILGYSCAKIEEAPPSEDNRNFVVAHGVCTQTSSRKR